MKGIKGFIGDPNFMALVIFSIWLALFASHYVHASSKKGTPVPPKAFTQGISTLKLTSEMIAPIRVMPGRSTILSFPTKPTKVILGHQGVFAVEYVENDLAIAVLSTHASSNLFVYLEGRRFAFNLMAVPSGGDSIVLVRDADAEGMQPKP